MHTHRYNLYKRVRTIMDKVDEGKQVKMQRVFLPKKKRRVLNRSKKRERPERVASACPATTFSGSQCSMGILDSQASMGSLLSQFSAEAFPDLSDVDGEEYATSWAPSQLTQASPPKKRRPDRMVQIVNCILESIQDARDSGGSTVTKALDKALNSARELRVLLGK